MAFCTPAYECCISARRTCWLCVGSYKIKITAVLLIYIMRVSWLRCGWMLYESVIRDSEHNFDFAPVVINRKKNGIGIFGSCKLFVFVFVLISKQVLAWRLGKYAYLHACWQFDEKINTSSVSWLQPVSLARGLETVLKVKHATYCTSKPH